MALRSLARPDPTLSPRRLRRGTLQASMWIWLVSLETGLRAQNRTWLEGPKECADGFSISSLRPSPISPSPARFYRSAAFIPKRPRRQRGPKLRPLRAFAEPTSSGRKPLHFRERTVSGQLPGILGGQPVSRFRSRNGPQGYPQIRWMMAGVTSARKGGFSPLSR